MQTIGQPPLTGSPPCAEPGLGPIQPLIGGGCQSAMWVYMYGGDVTAWDVENVLDSTYVHTTQAAVLDWTVTTPFFGMVGFVIASQISLAAGAGSLGGLAFSYDVYTAGAATAGATTPLTIWFDQFPGGVKTFDASISPTITTDGKWTHVSFTLDQLTPSGTSGACDPDLGLYIVHRWW